jgi:hypothetical protein
MMPKVIKLHGCSGAGKTSVARALMTAADNVMVVTPDKSTKPEAYVCEIEGISTPLAILGSYQANCGGMDTYSSNADNIIELIEGYRTRDCHVLFEGLLLSTYHGGVGKHLMKYGDDYILAFMDTPLLTCLDRIVKRRETHGTKTKFNPDNTRDKFDTIERLRAKAEAAGMRTIDINHVNMIAAVGQIKAILEDAS